MLLNTILKYAAAPLFLTMVASIIYTAGWGIYDDTYVRVGTFSLAAVTILYIHFSTKERSIWFRLIDLSLIAAVLAATYRYFWVSEELETGLYELEMVDMIYCFCGLAALAELVRRVVGIPLLIVCAVAFAYALAGEMLPSAVGHAGIDLSELLTTVWYSFDGIFGRPIAVVTSTILIFILFGALLEALGVGDVLLKLAFRVTRRFAGGDAHAAVLASGLFGTISGSSVANVVGTGVITIPMIKKRGFTAKFAGAVEAAASSGGQLMPPIMGAVAFIMADVTGIPYLEICLAAMIPALFYYGSLFAFISSEAHRMQMKPMKDQAVEPLTRTEKLKCLPFVLPLILIIVLMVMGSSPALAGFWAVITAAALGLAVEPQLLKQPQRLWKLLSSGAKSASTITVAVGAVGIIIAIMNGTGLGLRFAEAIQMVAEGNLFLSLVMMALGCLVLGMGMPTVPAYLIIILVMGPTVEALGVETIAAHLFVVYYAVLSAVTPPVALAAFAAAPIARANPISLSFTSLRLAIIGFLIPFAFVYQPSLLLINDDFSFISLIIAVFLTTVAVVMISMSFKLSGLIRWVCILIGLAAISPVAWAQMAAVVAAVLIVLVTKNSNSFLINKFSCK